MASAAVGMVSVAATTSATITMGGLSAGVAGAALAAVAGKLTQVQLSTLSAKSFVPGAVELSG